MYSIARGAVFPYGILAIMKRIVICSSASFYRQAVSIQKRLEERELQVVLPDAANRMKETGDFDVSHYKTWFGRPEDYTRKAELIKGHFDKIAQGDAILVLNYKKNDIDNYIGGNVLMEMGIAFHLGKPIFILNDPPENSSFEEEILGMQPIFLHGEVLRVADEYNGSAI